MVEVRDRNDQPVAGAVVRFAIQGGRASFNGARTLTVTTNAVGRAAVTGLTPTGSGATAGAGRIAGQPATFRFDFTGALNGAEVTGTLTLTITAPPPNRGGSASFPVTLR